MTDQDQRFQHRWQFRRTEIEVDSSSDEDHSRPSSASEPKVVKQNLVPFSNSEDNANQTVHSPTSNANEEKENTISSIKERPNSKQKQSGKTHEKKAKTRTNKKATSTIEPTNGALSDLKGHMASLVEEIKNARMDLLKWMDNELKSSSKVDTVSTKPSGTKKGQRQNMTRGKTQRSNPNNRRKKSGKVTQNGEGEPSGKKSSPINEEVVPSKETENVVITSIPVESTEKQKGKRPRLSVKKQKTAMVEADQQSNTTVAAAADNRLTLPSVLPQKQVENNERNPLNDGNEIDGEKRNTLNSGGSSSSYQVNFDPGAQQKDVVFAQNSMPRNVSNYEQNTGNTMGNGGGNGNGFPFPLVPQGSNTGIGMPNIPSQFALQYLTQGNRISGMYRDHPGFPSGNQAFMGSYGGLNQQMTYNFQQGEVMALQCPDIRRAKFNQGNIANQ